jgi:hypothetical protein
MRPFQPAVAAPYGCLCLVPALVCCLALGLGASERAKVSGHWETIPLQEYRRWHTATLLPDGRVLVVGGDKADPPRKEKQAGLGKNSNPPMTTEIFDPEQKKFTPGPRLDEPRITHAAVGLSQGVLITGGRDDLKSAVIFDPATNDLKKTGDTIIARQQHTMVALADGKVLVFGGGGRDRHLIAEIYDPETGGFTRTGDLIVPRFGCPATLLKDGRVLLTGGTSAAEATYNERLADAELYDPSTRTFVETGSMVRDRDIHSSTLLADGRVLIAGGINEEKGIFASAEIYDPQKGTFREISPLKVRRSGHAAVRLADGRVLITGGVRPGGKDTSTEIFDPAAEKFVFAEPMTTRREDHTMTLLKDGRVLVIGGISTAGRQTRLSCISPFPEQILRQGAS